MSSCDERSFGRLTATMATPASPAMKPITEEKNPVTREQVPFCSPTAARAPCSSPARSRAATSVIILVIR